MTVPCVWPSTCGCTHTDGCVAGWVDDEHEAVTRPCPNCRADLHREINRRQHVPGESSVWIRTMPRPIAAARVREFE
jgi:hypothetical protein